MLAVWAAASRPAAAGEKDDSAVQPAAYTTGALGSRLRWLPYRPSSARVAARQGERLAAAPAVALQAESNPFSDPFQENRPQASPAEPLLPIEPGQSAEPSAAVREAEAGEETLIEELLGPTATPPLGQPPALLPAECPKVTSKDYYRKIDELTVNVTPPQALTHPMPRECPVSERAVALDAPRNWASTSFSWTATGLCHKPLYFEEVQAERYGHSWGPLLQPAISQAHFFLTVPALPYKMGLTPPKECVYTLGYYRPGSCAPYMLDPLPLSVRAALWEAGAWLGAIYVLP